MWVYIISSENLSCTILFTWQCLIDTFVRTAFAQQEPGNITKPVGEKLVLIPCRIFESEPALPIWCINGKDYTSATLPSLFSQVAGGLFIGRIDVCLDGYTFQCIDTSGDGLVGRRSRIGTLTVTSDPPISLCAGIQVWSAAVLLKLNLLCIPYICTCPHIVTVMRSYTAKINS